MVRTAFRQKLRNTEITAIFSQIRPYVCRIAAYRAPVYSQISQTHVHTDDTENFHFNIYDKHARPPASQRPSKQAKQRSRRRLAAVSVGKPSRQWQHYCYSPADIHTMLSPRLLVTYPSTTFRVRPPPLLISDRRGRSSRRAVPWPSYISTPLD